ncbi:MAG: hypothetical protein A4E23_01104 [Methanomethylovorans sp. PtaU1.Bin073]|nr:MAG: hypothetical protein A4E23_01104 [Methanomethylovorans sp. PtaU1.Bin073]
MSVKYLFPMYPFIIIAGATPKEITSARESSAPPISLPPAYLAKVPSRPSAIAAIRINMQDN